MPQYSGMPAVLPALTTALFLLASPAAEPELDIEGAKRLMAYQEGRIASRLVKLTRSDEFFFNTFRAFSRKMYEAGKITAQQRACLDEIKIEEYNQLLSIMVASEHDEAQLENVFEFYSSSVGARYMRMVYEKNWRNSAEDFPLPPDRPKESVTLGEMREFIEFKESGRAGPFADPRMLMQWKQGRDAAATLFGVKRLLCKIPDEALPPELMGKSSAQEKKP